jgi:MFS family permease
MSHTTERSKAMGLVGAAFGLGLVTGPTLGALTVHINLAERFRVLRDSASIHFPSRVARVRVVCDKSVLDRSAIQEKRFRPGHARGHRTATAQIRSRRDPWTTESGGTADQLVAFVFSSRVCRHGSGAHVSRSARFGYTARENGILLGFLGFCAIVTQGYIVRKLLKVADEIRVLGPGSVSRRRIFRHRLCDAALDAVCRRGALLALGSGLVNPSTTGLISLYAGPEEQGRVLGIFRSLSALARAFTPVLAGIVFWRFGSTSVFCIGGRCDARCARAERQTAEAGEMKLEAGAPITEVRRRPGTETGDRRPDLETGDRRPETGNQRPEAGSWRTGVRKLEIGR